MRASPGIVFICYIVIQIDIGHHFYSTCALVSLPIPNPNQYPKYYPNNYLFPGHKYNLTDKWRLFFRLAEH